jgi:hypothetical protein
VAPSKFKPLRSSGLYLHRLAGLYSRTPGDPFRRHHRPRDPEPQRARRGAPKRRWDRLRAGLDLIHHQRGAPTWPICPAAPAGYCAGATRAGSRPAGDAHRPRRGGCRRRTPRPWAPGGRGTGAGEDPRGGVALAASPAAITLALDQRGADMADLPCGASGLLVRDSKGKENSPNCAATSGRPRRPIRPRESGHFVHHRRRSLNLCWFP